MKTLQATEGPQRALFAFAGALGGGQLGSSAAWFARDCCLVTPDGTTVHGRVAVRPLLAQLIARRTEIAIDQLTVRSAGEIAHASGCWTITSDGPGGDRFAQSCNPTVVLRKIECDWRLAIVAPWR